MNKSLRDWDYSTIDRDIHVLECARERDEDTMIDAIADREYTADDAFGDFLFSVYWDGDIQCDDDSLGVVLNACAREELELYA